MRTDGLTEGQTPLDPDEAEGLIPTHVRTRQELNEWEQANIGDAMVWLSRRRRANSVLSTPFVPELHRRMFGKTWRWAGKFRTTGKTIGIPASQIAEALHNLVEDTKEQVKNGLFNADEIAARFHHRLVSIHPFPNGNGRHARAMTDQLLRELGQPPFSWGSADVNRTGQARSAYLLALRAADNGDLTLLRAFVRS